VTEKAMVYTQLVVVGEAVMSDEREVALSMALKAVLVAARRQGLALSDLSDAAVDVLAQFRSSESRLVPVAIAEIELAVDVLKE
jgi:hypothetical protein